MVFLACDKMLQEIFCNHWRADCVDVPKSLHKRNLILSGKVGSLSSTKITVGQQQPKNSG